MTPSWQLRQRAQTLGNLAQITRSVGGIVSTLYDADRVAQVNRQLAYLEQSYQKYNETLDQRMFDARGEDITGPYGMQAPSVVQKPFDQCSLADIEADEEKFFQKQREYITKNTTNGDARREMIQHLNMKHIQNQGVIAKQWNVAAAREAMAGLETLYNTVLASNDPWEVKVNKITNRVNEMKAAGRLWPDQAQGIIAKATAAAQYSFAHDGAMTAMKETGTPDAGEAWLKKNTPFYDGNPDAREKVLNDVRQEFAYFAKTEDGKLDVAFADLHINAVTVDMVKQAITTLRGTRFYDGDAKYKWEMRFEQKLNQLENEGKLDSAALKAQEEAKKQNAALLRIAIEQANFDGRPPSVVKGLIDSQLYAEGGSTIPYEDAAAMYKNLNTLQPTGLKYALARLNEKGLTPVHKAKVSVDLVKFSEQHPDATDEQYLKAVENFIKPEVDRVLNAAWAGTWEVTADVLQKDKWNLSNAEKMTQDIQEGDFIGLTEERAEDLRLYCAYMLRLAKQRYPAYNFISVSPDTTGVATGNYGAAVLLDSGANQYYFKVEDKALVLYGYLGTRGNLQDKSWVRIGTEKSTLEEDLKKQKAAEEKAKAKAIEDQKLIEARRIQAEELRKKWGR